MPYCKINEVNKMDTEYPVSLENSYTIQFDSQNIRTELMKVINIILKEKSCRQKEIATILGVGKVGEC
ncbi:helix-turn-helix domain-containing protein [Wolbachia pipientis]|uniref:hypothetical protein n=1 Tax=Wolbachia pipientis TaxID=955 RepID=UPI0020B86CF8|nr:hypothetical protein [Wolbachia pipientis]